MSILDAVKRGISAAVSVVAPGYAAQYERQQMAYLLLREMLSGYDAAKITGPNQLWSPMGATADAEIQLAKKRSTNRSRDLDKNNPYVAGGLDKWENLVIGGGFLPQAKVRNLNGNGLDKEVCRLIEDWWYRWAESAWVNGDSWTEGFKTAIRHKKTDGDVLIHVVSLSDRPFALELLESDQLDRGKSGPGPNGTYVYDGIELNKYGQALAYYILEPVPGGWAFSSNSVRIPASDIIHLFKRKRASQHQGICEYASVVMPLYDHQKYREAALQVLRIAASYGIFIETPYPEDHLVQFIQNRMLTKDGQDIYNRLDYIAPAGVHYLRTGEKPNALKPEQPTQGYAEFDRSCLHAAASGFGLSYETLTGDYSQSNFSSSRMARLIEEAQARAETNYLIDRAGVPLYRRAIDTAVAVGDLDLPDYWRNRIRYQAVKFSLPAMAPVDMTKQVESDNARLAQGTITRAMICEREGLDFEEVTDTLAAEQEILKSKGLPVIVNGAPAPTPAAGDSTNTGV